MGINGITVMHTVHHQDLKVLLETLQPASILLIDPNRHGIPADYLAAHPECQVTGLKDELIAQLKELKRFDLGVVANTLEYLDHKTAGMVLARLRDIHTRRFVALVPIGEAWEDQRSYWRTADLLGYGMTIMTRYQVNDKPLYLFHYAIETYKSTPDWFNAKQWAHPELWRP